LIENGNRATTGAANAITGISRPFATPILATQNTTRWLSVLLRQENTSGVFNGFFGVYLDGGTVAQDDVFIGKPGGGQLNRFVVETRGGPGQVATTKPVVLNETVLLVLEANFASQPNGNEIFRLWANPDLSVIPPNATAATKLDLDIGQVNGLVIYSTGGFSVDEIRWGNTFFDVVPVPEPGSIALAGISMAAFALFGVRKLRRR
jgi:hypothetical protein